MVWKVDEYFWKRTFNETKKVAESKPIKGKSFSHNT